MNLTRLINRLVAVVAITTAFGCGPESPANSAAAPNDGKSEHGRLEHQFAAAQAELYLAESNRPYFIIDLNRRVLEIRLSDAVVWTAPLKIEPQDSQRVANFAETFEGDRHCLIKSLDDNYLYASREQVPESVLAIISEATNFKPGLMQRQVPGRFALRWDGPVTLDVVTDTASASGLSLRNKLHDMHTSLMTPFGGARIAVVMSPEAAITLYRIARPGLPTLLRFSA